MTAEQRRRLRGLEGRTVHLALADGTRIDEAALVSARSRTVWIFANGEDTFLRVDEVIDVWEPAVSRSAA